MGKYICICLAVLILANKKDVARYCKKSEYAWGLTLVSVGAIIYSAYSYLNSL